MANDGRLSLRSARRCHTAFHWIGRKRVTTWTSVFACSTQCPGATGRTAFALRYCTWPSMQRFAAASLAFRATRGQLAISYWHLARFFKGPDCGRFLGSRANCQLLFALHKTPNLATDNTDDTDLHGSKKFNWIIFKFVNPCDPCSSVVRFVFCAKPTAICQLLILISVRSFLKTALCARGRAR